MYMSFATTSYSVSFFAPTILRQFGWSAIRVQIMSVPMYVVAATSSLTCAFLADRFRHRFLFTVFGTLVATAGFIVLLLQRQVSINIQYMAIYFILAGAWTSQPICLAWLSANVAGHYKRGVATAVQVGIGNVSGFIASNLFIQSEAPMYRTGYGTAFGLLWFGGILCTVFVAGLYLENRKRNRGGRDGRLALPPHELDNLGDDHPEFRFSY
jgi:MFS family permease